MLMQWLEGAKTFVGMNTKSRTSLRRNEILSEKSWRRKPLKLVEEDIANSRKYYNGAVKVYNNKVEMFPSNIIAKLLGYKSQKMFSIEASERENVKVDLKNE